MPSNMENIDSLDIKADIEHCLKSSDSLIPFVNSKLNIDENILKLQYSMLAKDVLTTIGNYLQTH